MCDACGVALVLAGVWLIALLFYVIISLQIRKYNERHERDNEIINESMETFIGFIDAKDPYTNRVYRDKLTKEHILEEIERCKGKQFDPKIADVMISLIKNGRLDNE